MIIFFDTETTGLLKPELCELKDQPHITEIYCAKLDDELDFVDEYESMVNPPIPIPPEITKITGITDEDVEGEPEFLEIYPDLAEFFLGTRQLVAHNLGFDRGMLGTELTRIERLTAFPWPYVHTCTAERSIPIRGRRLGLKDLYQHATGRAITGHHRAKNDVMSMIECYRWMKGEGLV